MIHANQTKSITTNFKSFIRNRSFQVVQLSQIVNWLALHSPYSDVFFFFSNSLNENNIYDLYFTKSFEDKNYRTRINVVKRPNTEDKISTNFFLNFFEYSQNVWRTHQQPHFGYKTPCTNQ